MSRRQATLVMLLLYLHVPAFIAFLRAEDRAAGSVGDLVPYFAVFGVTAVIALVCLLLYLVDVARNPNLDKDARIAWIALLVILPQSVGFYWWWRFHRASWPSPEGRDGATRADARTRNARPSP